MIAFGASNCNIRMKKYAIWHCGNDIFRESTELCSHVTRMDISLWRINGWLVASDRNCIDDRHHRDLTPCDDDGHCQRFHIGFEARSTTSVGARANFSGARIKHISLAWAWCVWYMVMSAKKDICRQFCKRCAMISLFNCVGKGRRRRGRDWDDRWRFFGRTNSPSCSALTTGGICTR